MATTSASEIANYRGQAASALGGSAAGATGVYGDTDAERINRTFDAVAATNLAKNKEIYDKKIKDRDDLLNGIASKSISTNEMTDRDRDFTRSKFIDPMRQMLLDNPDLKSDTEKFLQFQKMSSDFEEAKIYGQSRLVELKKLDAEIASELDPETRKRMEEHRAKQESQDLYKRVTPFQKTLDYDEATFVKPTPITSSNQKIVGDKIVTTTTSHTRVADFIKQVNSNFIDGTNGTLANKMTAFADSFKRMPDMQKKQYLQRYNEKIDAINKQEKTKKGDPDYIEPLQYSLVPSDVPGQDRLMLHESDARLVLAESLLKNYVNSESEGSEISKLPGEIRKSAAEEAKLRKEISTLIPSQAYENMANGRKLNADAAKTVQETKDLRTKATTDGAVGQFYVNKVLSVFDKRTMKGLPTVGFQQDGKGGFVKDANGAVKKDPNWKGVTGTVLMANLPERDPKTGYVLKNPDGSVKNKIMSSLSDFDMNALALRFNDGSKGISLIKPERVIYNEDNPRDPYMEATYRMEEAPPETALDPANPLKAAPAPRVYYETRLIRPTDMLMGTIKTVQGESTTGAENKDYEKTAAWLQEKTGGLENFNRSMPDLLARPTFRMGPGDVVPANEAAPAAPAKPKKVVPLTAKEAKRKDYLFN